MPVPDPFREGMARGWKTYNGSQLTQDLTLEADAAVPAAAPPQKSSAQPDTRYC